jgi:hypothetical protein
MKIFSKLLLKVVLKVIILTSSANAVAFTEEAYQDQGSSIEMNSEFSKQSFADPNFHNDSYLEDAPAATEEMDSSASDENLAAY